MLDRMITELSQIKVSNNSTHDRCRAAIVFFIKMTEQKPEVMEFMLSSRHRDFLPDEKMVYLSTPFEMVRKRVKDGIVSDEIQLMSHIVTPNYLYSIPLRIITSRLDELIDKPLEKSLNAICLSSCTAVAAYR